MRACAPRACRCLGAAGAARACPVGQHNTQKSFSRGFTPIDPASKRTGTSTSRLPPARRHQARVDRARRARPPAGCRGARTPQRRLHGDSAAHAELEQSVRQPDMCTATGTHLQRLRSRRRAGTASTTAAVYGFTASGLHSTPYATRRRSASAAPRPNQPISSRGEARPKWPAGSAYVVLDPLGIGTDRTRTASSSAALCARKDDQPRSAADIACPDHLLVPANVRLRCECGCICGF